MSFNLKVISTLNDKNAHEFSMYYVDGMLSTEKLFLFFSIFNSDVHAEPIKKVINEIVTI